MRKIHEYLTDLWHPDGSPAIIAWDKVCDAQELSGGYVELIEYGGRRHTIKADKAQKRELLAAIKGWRKLNGKKGEEDGNQGCYQVVQG